MLLLIVGLVLFSRRSFRGHCRAGSPRFNDSTPGRARVEGIVRAGFAGRVRFALPWVWLGAANTRVAVLAAHMAAPHGTDCHAAGLPLAHRCLFSGKDQDRGQASDAGGRQALGESRICSPMAGWRTCCCSAVFWPGPWWIASRCSDGRLPRHCVRRRRDPGTMRLPSCSGLRSTR